MSDSSTVIFNRPLPIYRIIDQIKKEAGKALCKLKPEKQIKTDEVTKQLNQEEQANIDEAIKQLNQKEQAMADLQTLRSACEIFSVNSQRTKGLNINAEKWQSILRSLLVKVFDPALFNFGDTKKPLISTKEMGKNTPEQKLSIAFNGLDTLIHKIEDLLNRTMPDLPEPLMHAVAYIDPMITEIKEQLDGFLGDIQENGIDHNLIHNLEARWLKDLP